MRRVAMVAAAVAMVGAATYPMFATAGHVMVSDANDTRGLFDVRRVDVEGSERPRWTVVTYSEWTATTAWDKGFVLVKLDTFGDRRFDKYVLVSSNGYTLDAELWRDRRDRPDVRIGDVAEWRPNRRSVTIRLPLHKLDIPPQRAFYRWQVETLWSARPCPQVCLDLAPQKEPVTEPVPGREPTPTPTVTISPTPTVEPSPTVTP